MPEELRLCLETLLGAVGELTSRIREMDHQIQQVIEEHYPEALLLQQISGVGPITALAFVLLVEDPRRFEQSREVGA